MKTQTVEVSCSVPVRRTLWTSFWIGVAAVVVTFILAAALIGLMLLSPVKFLAMAQ